MGNIRAALAPLLADARLDLSEAKTLTGRIPGTPAAEATADLVAIAKQYAGVISEDAWGELETAAHLRCDFAGKTPRGRPQPA
jgi:hypothetical protein